MMHATTALRLDVPSLRALLSARILSVAVLSSAALGFLLLGPNAAEAQTYTYDAQGRLASVSYGDGQSLTYTYDPGGNILTVEQLGGDPPDGGVPTDGGTAQGSDGGGTDGSTRLDGGTGSGSGSDKADGGCGCRVLDRRGVAGWVLCLLLVFYISRRRSARAR